MGRQRITVVVFGILLMLPPFLASCNRSGDDDGGEGFPFGVASGDVTSTSAVLWTRTDRDATLALEVATSADFAAPLAFQQTAHSTGATDFTAEVIAEPLLPDTPYFYRWRQGEDTSETGAFRTAPAENVTANLRFVYSGDMDGALADEIPFLSDFENVFEVLDGMRREGADFFVFLGDTVYADSLSLARIEGPASSLDEYRDLYKDNRDISPLPNLLQTTSVYAVWDDHEVRNDFAGRTVDPRLYANGRQAFLEYMPIDERNFPADPDCAGTPMFRVVRWGAAVEMFILDERSCRSANVKNICQNDFAPTLPDAERENLLGLSDPPPSGCRAALFNPARTMLGAVQKERFKEALRTSTATFKLVINEVLIQQLWARPYDRWEGYAAERAEILNFIRDHNIRNVIFISTDMHANFINEVFVDHFSAPTPVAHEFVTGPIVAATLEAELKLSLEGSRLDDFHELLNLAGVDCRELDTFSYGVVEVDAAADTLSVTLKDASGAIIKDQRRPAILCQKTIGP